MKLEDDRATDDDISHPALDEDAGTPDDDITHPALDEDAEIPDDAETLEPEEETPLLDELELDAGTEVPLVHEDELVSALVDVPRPEDAEEECCAALEERVADEDELSSPSTDTDALSSSSS